MTTATTMTTRRDFRAMGTDCSVVVFGSSAHVDVMADLAQRRVHLLESLWSRFRSDSELSRLNDRAGTGPVPVSWETELLVGRMRQAWEATDGAFDPTVLAAVRAQGYDRDLAEVLARESIEAIEAIASQRSPGMTGVTVADGAVTLARGVGIDPGAIGKGLAADLIVDEIYSAGAMGVLVDLGGDMAMAGCPGSDTEWAIEIRDERTKLSSGRRVEFPTDISHAGVATSTTLTRRFADARHHVIDPGTGYSSEELLVQVSASSTHAWWAEVWATASLVRPTLLAGGLPADVRCLAFASESTLRDDFSQDHDKTKGQVA